MPGSTTTKVRLNNSSFAGTVVISNDIETEQLKRQIFLSAVSGDQSRKFCRCLQSHFSYIRLGLHSCLLVTGFKGMTKHWDLSPPMIFLFTKGLSHCSHFSFSPNQLGPVIFSLSHLSCMQPTNAYLRPLLGCCFKKSTEDGWLEMRSCFGLTSV